MRTALLTTIVASLALAAAGCGGGSSGTGVASVATSTAPTSNKDSTPVTGSANPEAYAKCMRSHGVPTFPDPNSKGQVNPGSIANLNSPQYRNAQTVCHALLPSGYGNQSGSLTPQQQTEFLKFARCMRAHGVPKFADPTSSGLSLSGVDPNTPQFKSAQQACRSLLPNRGQAGSAQTTGGSGK